jgi:hypothetical protein
MRKEIKTIKVKEYILEPKDLKTIRECLNYAFHRLTKHVSSGIDGIVDPDEVKRLRRELNII